MKRVSLAVALMLPLSVASYEVGTHALVTKVAYDQSVLSPTHPKSIVATLLLDRLDVVAPFRMAGVSTPDRYLDLQPLADPIPAPTISLSNIRNAHRYEGQLFDGLLGRGYISEFTGVQDLEVRVPGWLMRGAVREDDNDGGPALVPNIERDLDPHGQVFRALRHFYNPIDNDGFNFSGPCLVYGCRRSTEWALGRTGVLAAPGTIDASRENHFSWQDARNYYWWMLTANYAVGGTLTTKKAAASFGHSVRGMMGASMLKSVGQVVHLVQDAAQPQHVRNDAHSPPNLAVLTLDDSSDGAYEAFTEARIFRELSLDDSSPFAHLQGAHMLSADAFPPIHLRGNVSYAVPVFRSPDRFFTTRAEDSLVANRRGMADVTNRGFFSASTLPVDIADADPGSIMSRFTDPILPTGVGADYQEVLVSTALFADGVVIKSRELVAVVPDTLQPDFNAQSGLFSTYGGQGRVPVLTASQRRKTLDLIDYGAAGPVVNNSGFSIGYNVMVGNADALLPRAVAYSAGLINYFFRGKLDVEVPDMALIAVMNQGETHSVDAEGYPRRPDQSIFGFTKARLKVRNATAEIIESGSGTHSVQNASNGQLVAIARYHRNACYKIDLSGQRTQGYSAAPPAPITAPTCTAALPERTDYEEISISAPIAISGADALPGMVGATSQAWVDKIFDFGADPIPVNATDLFFQVVYRGTLGDEPDGIAVGRLDVREPTFVAAYNGSDHRWTGTAWTPGSIGTTTRAADFFHLCGGSPTKLLYRNAVAPALRYAVGATPPEVVRIAFVTDASPNNRVFRAQPTMIPSPSAGTRIFTTKGAIRQAGRELISATTAAVDCTTEPVAGNDAWCNTPSKRRRGQVLGDAYQAIYYSPSSTTASIDVDAAGLPAYPSLIVRSDGENRFNDDATLIDCPNAPALTQEQGEWARLLEEAADLGLDVN